MIGNKVMILHRKIRVILTQIIWMVKVTMNQIRTLLKRMDLSIIKILIKVRTVKMRTQKRRKVSMARESQIWTPILLPKILYLVNKLVRVA